MIPIKLIQNTGQKKSGLSKQPSSSLVQAKINHLSQGTFNVTTLPPLSLYIHFPWCAKKCPYCDFNSHVSNDSFPEDEYLTALRLDLERSLPLIWGRKIYTVFIGGGTPSLISARGIDRLISDIRALLPLDTLAEITMEANPSTFEFGKFKSYRSSGINRLSLGIQSFNDSHLKALGRIHSCKEARKAIEIAHSTFDNFNLDLMYGLPSQTLKQAYEDAVTAINFSPQHLSFYNLTLEPNTYFAKYPPKIPNSDISSEMQDTISEFISSENYSRYEVSSYSKSGRQALHNINYWKFGDYLGIGAGAHSKLSFPHHIIRYARYKKPESYLKNSYLGNVVQEEIKISPNDIIFEFMLNALRLNNGFEVNLFNERTSLSFSSVESLINKAESKGLLYRDHRIIQSTVLGKKFLNDLQEIFLPD